MRAYIHMFTQLAAIWVLRWRRHSAKVVYQPMYERVAVYTSRRYKGAEAPPHSAKQPPKLT
eukprot:1158344-Pelagomonas_calceolata.AAC.19